MLLGQLPDPVRQHPVAALPDQRRRLPQDHAGQPVPIPGRAEVLHRVFGLPPLQEDRRGLAADLLPFRSRERALSALEEKFPEEGVVAGRPARERGASR